MHNSKRCALDFGYLHRHATDGIIARDALWILDICIGFRLRFWCVLEKSPHLLPPARTHAHACLAVRIPPPLPKWYTHLSHPGLIPYLTLSIFLKRYCHGCDGFVCYKKQNPTTSSGPYARACLPAWIKYAQLFPSCPMVHPLVLPPSNTLFHL